MENKLYRLEEMVDAIEQSKDNIHEVVGQQMDLIEIVQNSEKAEEFEDFLKESQEQVDNLNKQYEQLSMKQEAVETLIKLCKASEDAELAFELLSTALGLFEE